MDRVHRLTDNILLFFCPGCDEIHRVRIAGDGPKWTWNGSLESPTLSPAIYHHMDDKYRRCQCEIIDGEIRYTMDSMHCLAGQTLRLRAWPEEVQDGSDIRAAAA